MNDYLIEKLNSDGDTNTHITALTHQTLGPNSNHFFFSENIIKIRTR